MQLCLYFQTFVDYGFIFSSVRDISKNRDKTETVSIIFSTTMYARMILTIISFIFFIVIIYAIPFLYEMRVVLFFTFLIVPGHAMFAEWLFQGIEKMKYITIFNLLMKAIFTICIFVFIKDKTDYYLQPLFTALGYITSGLISLIVIYNYNISIYNHRTTKTNQKYPSVNL